MRVIAATFNDRNTAGRVLADLRRAYELGAEDVDLAPLGTTGDGAAAATVLAGRFREERVESVRSLVEQNGGRVVMDVDESATKKRVTPSPASAPQNERPDYSAAAGERGRLYL